MFTDKSVLPLRPRHHIHASMLLDGSEDDHAVSTSSLRPPTKLNDSQTCVHTRAVSARVRIVSSIGISLKYRNRNTDSMRHSKCYNFKVQVATCDAWHSAVYWCKQDEIYLVAWWCSAVPNSWSRGRGFNSRPLHCRATTLGKLFTPVCLCSPSSIIWYLWGLSCQRSCMWQPMAWVQWTREVLS